MKPFSRADRVSGQVQRAISELLHKRIRDPRLKDATISEVKMSPDLKLAKVYYTLSHGESTQADAQAGFNSASGFVKRTLARKLGLRYMPDLKFFYDESFDYGAKIDHLLKSLDIKDATDSQSSEK
ncbi:MAG: 30S ribosome-binding factor RbfA [Desulfobacterales bacterium]|nr:30S ribosome-binding factor RbfA [Desulfobacterales bacterium]